MHKQNKKKPPVRPKHKIVRPSTPTKRVGLALIAIVLIAGVGAYVINKSMAATVPPGKIYRLPAAAPKPKPLPRQDAMQDAMLRNGADPVVTDIPKATWDSMVGKSWHSGCPVGRNQLVLMRVNYWGFDGYRYRGELVFSRVHKAKFISAFTGLYNKGVPMHGMYLPDRFGYSARTNGADDYASMEHDNTSAFNCRWVVGSPGTLSPHSYGTAVDINPFENPYHSASGWEPNEWWSDKYYPPYTWRAQNEPVVKIMTDAGFRWTYGTGDAQHFDVN